MADSVTFRATFPNLQSAIKIDGEAGMRIVLDIAESEMAEAMKLVLYRNIVLKVTVEPDNGKEETTTKQRRRVRE